MAQLRLSYPEIQARGAEVVVVGPEDAPSFSSYWQRHELPFIGLPDPQHRVADAFGQQRRLLQLGRMPALVIIDRQGQVRFARYGESMRDLVSADELLAAIDQLNQTDGLADPGSPRHPA